MERKGLISPWWNLYQKSLASMEFQLCFLSNYQKRYFHQTFQLMSADVRCGQVERFVENSTVLSNKDHAKTVLKWMDFRTFCKIPQNLAFPDPKWLRRHYQSRVGCYLLDKPSLVMLEITMTSFGATAPLVVKNKIENEPAAAAAATRRGTSPYWMHWHDWPEP